MKQRSAYRSGLLALLAAACACVLALLPAAALADTSHTSKSPGAMELASRDASSALVQASGEQHGQLGTGSGVDQFDDAAGADRSDADQAAGSKLHDLSITHTSKKSRRAQRRFRSRGRGRGFSAHSRVGTRSPKAAPLKLERKRGTSKRALMRRLMSVRGGLQT